MKFGVVVFPGSNCDDDMIHVLGKVMGQEVVKIWHKDSNLASYGQLDCIVLPGGFSFGDYLRAGAIAQFSPIMTEVVRFAKRGGLVYGICNGFQVLCELGLLTGVLLRNRDQKFICKNVYLKTISNDSPITAGIEPGKVLKIPIAHAEGRYMARPDELEELKNNDQVIFRYCDADGEVNEESNINGSTDNIAGIVNKQRNVVGMMPHPERASEAILGNEDGKLIFESLINTLVVG